MKSNNRINLEDKWKETLEEWTPEVEVTSWEKVASEIPKGRAANIRRFVERNSIKAFRSVARLVSLKRAVVAISSAVVLSYVAYSIFEKTSTIGCKEVNASNIHPSIVTVPLDHNEGGMANDVFAHVTGDNLQPGNVTSDAQMNSPFIIEDGAVNTVGASLIGVAADKQKGGVLPNENSTSAPLLLFGSILDPSVGVHLSGKPVSSPLIADGADAKDSGITEKDRQMTFRNKASFLMSSSNAEEENGDDVSSRNWIKSHRIAKGKKGLSFKHRRLPRTASWEEERESFKTIPFQTNKSMDADRIEFSKPISMGNGFRQRILPSFSLLNFHPIQVELPSVQISPLSYISVSWGANVDCGFAHGGSTNAIYAGLNVYTDVMYKSRIGLELSAGGRWVGVLPNTLSINSSTDVGIPENPNDTLRLTTMSNFYQLPFGLDAVVLLSSSYKSSMFAKVGVRGCWSNRAKSDSSSRQFSPLSAVRITSAFCRKTPLGRFCYSPFVEYQFKEVGVLPKSSFMIGFSVGATF